MVLNASKDARFYIVLEYAISISNYYSNSQVRNVILRSAAQPMLAAWSTFTSSEASGAGIGSGFSAYVASNFFRND